MIDACEMPFDEAISCWGESDEWFWPTTEACAVSIAAAHRSSPNATLEIPTILQELDSTCKGLKTQVPPVSIAKCMRKRTSVGLTTHMCSCCMCSHHTCFRASRAFAVTWHCHSASLEHFVLF
jgi:hypothetical protein